MGSKPKSLRIQTKRIFTEVPSKSAPTTRSHRCTRLTTVTRLIVSATRGIRPRINDALLTIRRRILAWIYVIDGARWWLSEFCGKGCL